MLELGPIRLTWRDILDIALVTFIFYRLMLLIRGTRAVSILYGLVLILLMYFLSEELGLYTLSWLLANFLGSIFLVVIILFQQDIRRALAQVGAGRLWRRGAIASREFDEIIGAALTMAQRRVGALIVIERNVPLGDYVEKGVSLDARISRELMLTIFHPYTPLHDGAVIIRDKRLVAASCILPLAGGLVGGSDYGTRHRAGMGITEETDAVALVVSEERGVVSVAVNGKLTSGLDATRLRRVLRNTLDMGKERRRRR